MAKEIAISKIAKISQAQQYMLLSVLGASVFLGAGISLTKHFVEQIMFNANYIAAEEQSIAAYSDVISKTGVCMKPKGSVYTKDEIEKCDPETIDTKEIEGTLRYNIIDVLATNQALNSVPQDNNTNCTNPITDKPFTYKELNQEYKYADSTEARQAALARIKSCSALRVIPDALPSFQNNEALLSSLNRIFILSGWEPESISPSGGSSSGDESESTSLGAGIEPIDVNLSIEANTEITMNVLNNIERSIREFNIKNATIEYNDDRSFTLNANASAYYTNESSIQESSLRVTTEGVK